MHLSSSLLFWLLGFVLILWGGMKVLVVAFGRSILWGLATLFVPFANLLFVCTHWKETKSGFLMGFGGCAMCLGIVLCNPEMRTEIRALAHLPFLIETWQAPTSPAPPIISALPQSLFSRSSGFLNRIVTS